MSGRLGSLVGGGYWMGGSTQTRSIQGRSTQIISTKGRSTQRVDFYMRYVSEWEVG